MILRHDRLGLEIPSGDPDRAGAIALQELMGPPKRRPKMKIVLLGATGNVGQRVATEALNRG
jgi:hypothetical protein